MSGTSTSPSGPPGSRPDSPESVWSQPRFVLAGVIVALLAVAALVLIVLGPPGNDSATSTPGSTPATTPTAGPASSGTGATPAAGEASVCGLAPGEQTVPQSPPRTTWVLVGSVAAPNAPATVGPGTTRAGLRSCYARSPLGVLYAAAGFLAATSDPQLRPRAVRDLTAQGSGREQALRLIAQETSGTSQAPGPSVQIAGFSFLTYDPGSSVVDVAMKSEGRVVHLPVSTRWQDGDWRVVLPPTGDLYAAIQALPDLTGYIPWDGA